MQINKVMTENEKRDRPCKNFIWFDFSLSDFLSADNSLYMVRLWYRMSSCQSTVELKDDFW